MLNGHDLLNERNHKIVTYGMAHIPEGRHVFTRMTVQEKLEMGAFSLKRCEDERRVWDHGRSGPVPAP